MEIDFLTKQGGGVYKLGLCGAPRRHPLDGTQIGVSLYEKAPLAK